MKGLLALLIVITFIACSKNDEKSFDFLDCDEHTGNYKDYAGEDIGCQFFYTLTEYNNQQFIELNSYCADLVRPFVINENCEDICEYEANVENSVCSQYLNNREIIEIILIEK